MEMARAGANLSWALYHSPSTTHGVPEKFCKICDAMDGHPSFSIDYAGYDKTMSAAFQDELKRAYSRYLRPDEVERWWKQLQSPVLTGPVIGANSIGYLCDKMGQLSSGTRTTSADGCFLNVGNVINAMAVTMGWTKLDCVRRYKSMNWYFALWGDDTVIWGPKDARFSKEKFVDNMSLTGLKATEDPEIVFLMKRFFKRKDTGKYDWHPVGSRILQNTWCGEFPKGWKDGDSPSDISEVKIMTLLRLYARTQGAEKGPLWKYIEPKLVGSESPIWKGGLEVLRRHVESSRFKKAIQDLGSAQSYFMEMEKEEGRFVSLSKLILEAAGVSETGASKLEAIRWLHRRDGAVDMSDDQRSKLLHAINNSVSMLMNPYDDSDHMRSRSQRKTDRLKERKTLVADLSKILGTGDDDNEP
jgi:hypothetical protein